MRIIVAFPKLEDAKKDFQAIIAKVQELDEAQYPF